MQRVADSDVSVVNGEEVLVRLAVERYRLMYNGRLISRNEEGSAGLLTFESCEVAVSGDWATATCVSGLPGLSVDAI